MSEPDDMRLDFAEQDAKDRALDLWDQLHGPDPSDLIEVEE